jgi:hypothetical protein
MYQVYGRINQSIGSVPFVGVRVRAGALSEVTTALDGTFTLEAVDSIEALFPVTVRDGKGIPVDVASAHTEIGPRGEPHLQVVVQQRSGLAAGESWMMGERVCIDEACCLSDAELEVAYAYSVKGAPKNTAPPALLKAFPDLERPQYRPRGDECGAWCPSAVLHFASTRGLDVKAMVERTRSVSSAPAIYARGRVKVTYAPAEIVHNPQGTEVVQPGGRTLAGTIDPDLRGVPSRVQRLAVIAEDAISRLEALGLQTPEWSPESPLEIRVRRPGRFDDYYGWTSDLVSFIEINPAMPSAQDFSVIPHEIAHRFQIEARRMDGEDHGGLCKAIREGGARLLEDHVFERANKYVADAEFHFQNPESAFFSGTRPYATGLFWKYLAERYGTTRQDPSGLGVYRDLLAVVKQSGYTFNALRELCMGLGTKLEDVWFDFLLKNLLHNLSSAHAYRDEHQVPYPGADGAHAALSALTVHLDPRTMHDLEPWAAVYHGVSRVGRRSVALTHLAGGAVIARGIHLDAQGQMLDDFTVPTRALPKPVTLRSGERLVLLACTVYEDARFQIAVL